MHPGRVRKKKKKTTKPQNQQQTQSGSSLRKSLISPAFQLTPNKYTAEDGLKIAHRKLPEQTIPEVDFILKPAAFVVSRLKKKNHSTPKSNYPNDSEKTHKHTQNNEKFSSASSLKPPPHHHTTLPRIIKW